MDAATVLSVFILIFCSMCIPNGYLFDFHKEFQQWILRFKKVRYVDCLWTTHLFYDL